METLIRKAEPDDAEQLFAMASQLAISTRVEKNAFRLVFHELLITDHAQLIVAEQRGSLIGYVSGSYRLCFYANGRVAWIEELFVDEQFRGQAVGRRLMGYFEEWASSKQCQGVALATRSAAPFYNGNRIRGFCQVF